MADADPLLVDLKDSVSFERRVNRQRASHRLSGLLYALPKATIAAVRVVAPTS